MQLYFHFSIMKNKLQHFEVMFKLFYAFLPILTEVEGFSSEMLLKFKLPLRNTIYIVIFGQLIVHWSN